MRLERCATSFQSVGNYHSIPEKVRSTFSDCSVAVLSHLCELDGGMDDLAVSTEKLRSGLVPAYDPVVFAQFDEDFYRAGRRNSSRRVDSGLWPPPQNQKLYSGAAPLTWQSGGVLEVSVDSMESLDVFLASSLSSEMALSGLRTQVIGTHANYASSSRHALHLYLSPAICPEPHGYEMQIDANVARLVAADCIGLQYAIDSLLQLLRIQNVTGAMSVPAMVVSDRPDVESRTAVWTATRLLSMSVRDLAENVNLLSRLRYAAIELCLDGDSASCSSRECGADDIVADSKMFVLQSQCELTRIRLVHRLVVTANGKRSAIRGYGFQARPVPLVVAVGGEESKSATHTEEQIAVCCSAVQEVLQEAMQAGFKDVLLSAPDWLRATAAVSEIFYDFKTC